MSPKVAVLMCAHNSELFIREAIESILSQTFSDFEFIIVENGSNDRTWEIIKSYTDPRIKAFQTPFKQLTFNVNFGLMQTKAEFIARMDVDDIAYPDRLSRQVDFLDSNPDVVILGTAFKSFGDNTETKIVHMPALDNAIRSKLPFRFCLCHPSVMFRRKIIVDIGGYQGSRFCQDFDLWLRLLRNENIKFANLPEPLLKYRIHSNQIKGSRESYATSAGILLREALLGKSPRLFIASVFACLKIFRSSKHP